MNEIDKKLPRRVILTKIEDGLGYVKNDKKYLGKAYNQLLVIKAEIRPKLFLTDFYQSEFSELNNDYIRYGFLIVTLGNVEVIDYYS